ncbi:MAG: hypothetical protein KC619_35255 [Myxococcales bacterium]|nr:hypothetical protein [Myxococcales bacterium]
MRVRVKSSWRTRLLLLLAFVAAGLIAYMRVQGRVPEPREAPAPAPPEGVVDVEIVAE